MAPLLPDHLLEARDIDLSPATLRRVLTPHPAEQQLTLIVLAGYVALVTVSIRSCSLLYLALYKLTATAYLGLVLSAFCQHPIDSP